MLSYLSLSEGDGVKLVPTEALVLSKFEQGHGGVSTRGQHEDKGSTAVGVPIRLGQVERWRLDELLTQLAGHKQRDGSIHLHTDNTQHHVTDVVLSNVHLFHMIKKGTITESCATAFYKNIQIIRNKKILFFVFIFV